MYLRVDREGPIGNAVSRSLRWNCPKRNRIACLGSWDIGI